MNNEILKQKFLNFKKKTTFHNVKKIISYIEKKNLNINDILFDDYSLLHIKQKHHTMKYLIDKGGNVNLKNLYGITPVMVQFQYKTIVLLVNHGADIYQRDDKYYFSILHWQKEPKAMKYLIKKDVNIHCFNKLFQPKTEPRNSIYIELLIHGGYDPYSEKYISISPLFLQRNYKTQEIIMKYYGNNFIHCDMFLESPLFKPCITTDIIDLYLKYGENINYQNLLGNTLLHVHNDPNIILFLLQKNADLTIRNILNYTPYIFHLKNKHITIINIIETYYSSRLIQRNWLRYNFKKQYVPIRNYKKKQKLIQYLKILPPSNCGIFPGGIEYQQAFLDFKNLIKIYEELE